MNSTLVAVNFNNQSLLVTMVNDVPHVALKPICENLGIDWEGQRQKIMRHPILSEGACMIKAPSNGGIQEMLMLPIRMLNGWLFGVDSSRVNANAKEAVIKYQRECFDVLANHFMPKRNALRDLPPATPKFLTTAMLRHIQKRVSWLSFNQVGSSHEGLGKLIKDTFNVHKRDMIPFDKYREVCTLLGCEPDAKALQGDLLEPVILPAPVVKPSFKREEILKHVEFNKVRINALEDLINGMKRSNELFKGVLEA
jgi:hypothetical protein